MSTPQVTPYGDNGNRLAWILGLNALALLVALVGYLASLQPNILALQFSFDQASFQSVLASWQPMGVLRYRIHLPIDFGLLICYGAFGYVVTRNTLVFAGFSPLARMGVCWSMPAAALCDAIENSLHWHLTSRAAHADSLLYPIAGVSSVLKFALLGFFLLSYIAAVVRPRPPIR
jgi:hypothetical protein